MKQIFEGKIPCFPFVIPIISPQLERNRLLFSKPESTQKTLDRKETTSPWEKFNEYLNSHHVREFYSEINEHCGYCQ